MPGPESLPFTLHLVQVFAHASAWLWRPAARSHHNLWIALEGGGQLVVNGQEHAVVAGSAFLLRPEDAVEGWSDRQQRLVNFAAHFSGDARVLREFGLAGSSGPMQLDSATWLPSFCRHLSQLFFIDRERHHAELLQGLRFLLLSLQARTGAPRFDKTERKILQLVEKIRQDPAGHNSIEQLARAAGLSVSQFTRRFRLLTGFSPNRFAIEERLARAESYLRDSPLTIEAIAERLGYSDVYFFSRQFRRFRGLPPSAYRARGA